MAKLEEKKPVNIQNCLPERGYFPEGVTILHIHRLTRQSLFYYTETTTDAEIAFAWVVTEDLLNNEEDVFEENPPPYNPENVDQHNGSVKINITDSRLGYSNRACNVTGYYHASDKHCHLVIDQPVTAQISIHPTEYKLHSWLGFAICVTMCCCLPTGLLAIFTAVKANEAASAGELQKAQSRSRLSRNLIITSLILGLGVWIFVIYSILTLSYELVHNDWGHGSI